MASVKTAAPGNSALKPLSELSQRISLVLCDFDGTFANDAGGVDPLNVKGFVELRRCGLPVGFCTGRSIGSVLKTLGPSSLAEMEYEGFPGVYCNGAIAYGPKGDLLYESTLRPETQAKILSVFEKQGVLNCALGIRASDSYCQELNKWSLYEHTEFGEVYPTLISPQDGGLAAKAYNKVMICHTPETIAALREAVEAELGPSVHVCCPYPMLLEVTEKGVTKGTGLKALAEHLKIQPDEVLALGDSENDVPMFQATASAVVVTSGSVVAKAAAKFETVGPGKGPLLSVAKHLAEKQGAEKPPSAHSRVVVEA